MENVKPMHPVGTRLKEEVQRVGGSAAADAVLKSSKSTLYNWFESGLIPGTELQALSQIGIDVLYVVTGVRNLAEVQDRALQAAAGSIEGLNKYLRSAEARKIPVRVGDQFFSVDPADYRWIPFFDAEIAAGYGRVVDPTAPPKKFNAYRRDYLEEAGLAEAELFEAKIIGDSMEPDIRSGEVVLVNASFKGVVSGEAYIISIGEEFMCKYLQRLPGGRIEITSANPLHKPFTIREGEIGQGVEIVGMVWRQSRDRYLSRQHA